MIVSTAELLVWSGIFGIAFGVLLAYFIKTLIIDNITRR